jgi:hypothetical protein
MKNGKDVKPKEQPNHEPDFDGFSYDEFFQNQLSLKSAIKDYLNEKGLDWRFINAGQFRSQGNTHQSHWTPIKFENVEFGQNSEGYIHRGDLILAGRPKRMGVAHRKFLAQRNALQSSVNRSQAQQLRQSMRSAGVSGKVSEGYEDNE